MVSAVCLLMEELRVGDRLVPVNQINQALQMVRVECVSVRDLQDSGIILYFLLIEIICKLQRTNRRVGHLKTLIQAKKYRLCRIRFSDCRQMIQAIRATINPSNPNAMNTTKRIDMAVKSGKK